MDDLLGFDRFDQHLSWTAAGHVEGDVDEPRTFIMGRQDDRWVLYGDGNLLVIGDAARDLVAEDGSLIRRPVTKGFQVYTAACLLRRIGFMAGQFEVIGEPTESQHAGQPAVDVNLKQQGFELTLGVDAETGVWTWMKTEGLEVVIDEFKGDDHPMFSELSSFYILGHIPDIDLSQRVPVAEDFVSVLNAVQEASGMTVEVMYQDEETGEFRFIMLDADGEEQGILDRRHAGSTYGRPIFAGIAHSWDTDEWSYNLDSTNPDLLWTGRIVKALQRP